MHSIPIRGSSQTQKSHRPNINLPTKPNSDPAPSPTVSSHGILPSPIHSDHPSNSDNGSTPCSLSPTHLSLSLEVQESPVDDHMDWTPPSLTLPTQNNSDTSASSSDSDTPLPHEHPIKLSDLLPLPNSSPGPLTYAHQQAMAHRVTYDRLIPGGAFNPSMYTPVFLHDTLMLPGSLASVLGKVRFHLFHPINSHCRY
jgi:hypothetical protein